MKVLRKSRKISEKVFRKVWESSEKIRKKNYVLFYILVDHFWSPVDKKKKNNKKIINICHDRFLGDFLLAEMFC